MYVCMYVLVLLRYIVMRCLLGWGWAMIVGSGCAEADWVGLDLGGRLLGFVMVSDKRGKKAGVLRCGVDKGLGGDGEESWCLNRKMGRRL